VVGPAPTGRHPAAALSSALAARSNPERTAALIAVSVTDLDATTLALCWLSQTSHPEIASFALATQRIATDRGGMRVLREPVV
jgi:hypothetical protein